ncbi:MAG: sigma-70 family RNA polymerase sigma factor [Planctomycetes bacterium]|nr:sigma-70 family RNA polymerase sigma factor [Planctomycetota bacterium]
MLAVRDRLDAEAFEALYQRHARGLLNFFLRLSWDRQGADDLLQETFLRLWRSSARYQPIAKFRTFLFQIGKNLWLNDLERFRRMPKRAPVGAEEVLEAPEPGVPGGVEDPMEAASRGELSERLVRAIARLSKPYRLVFVLGACQELPYREVAAILDIPEGTVKSRMFKACAALRQILGGAISPGEAQR